MNISEFTTEDFVLDPSFKRWVLKPDALTNLKWENLLQKYPYQRKNVTEARDILIHLSIENFEFPEEYKKNLWKKINRDIVLDSSDEVGARVVPLNAKSTLDNHTKKKDWNYWLMLKVSCWLIFGMGLVYVYHQQTHEVKERVLEAVVYEERLSPPGVKTQLKLADGTKILLNSNSRLKFPRNFDQLGREVFLEGEAYFEVAKDSLKPFSVKAGNLKTVVLGTAFNIREYQDGKLDISLVSGEISVENPDLQFETLKLKPGEMVRKTDRGLTVNSFDVEATIGWIKKIILFQDTPLLEAIKVLEDWYGVTIDLENVPKGNVTFSGRYQDETLKNVLKGLSYVCKFDFTIKKNLVTIRFKDHKN